MRSKAALKSLYSHTRVVVEAQRRVPITVDFVRVCTEPQQRSRTLLSIPRWIVRALTRVLPKFVAHLHGCQHQGGSARCIDAIHISSNIGASVDEWLTELRDLCAKQQRRAYERRTSAPVVRHGRKQHPQQATRPQATRPHASDSHGMSRSFDSREYARRMDTLCASSCSSVCRARRRSAFAGTISCLHVEPSSS